MEIIHNNPFRIAGILSNATERELQKQKAKIQAYSRVGKEIKSEYDFEILKNITRTGESIDRAFSNVVQNQDKVRFALFWFLDANPFDNTAIEYLKSGDTEKAIEIWEKVTLNKEVSSKNFSSFNNLGTAKLLSQTSNEIKAGIDAKIELIESEFFENFVHSVADITFQINKDKQIEELIDELLAQFKSQYSSPETLYLFSKCNGNSRKYLLQKLTQEPLHTIERQIEITKNKRKENRGKAYEHGLRLYGNCKDYLPLLVSLLGVNDLKYKMIADNLAKEVMQCGIDYFKHWQETNDPSKNGLELLGYAKSFAVGIQTKERIKENTEGIQEWAKTAPIKAELDFIIKKLIDFRSKNDSIANANDLVTSCKPKLLSMKNIVGSSDEEYINLSTAIANSTLGMLVSVINAEQNNHLVQLGMFESLKTSLRGALSVAKEIESLDMKSEQRTHFNSNYRTLKSIASQLEISTPPISSSTYRPSSTPRPTPTYQSTDSDNDGCTAWFVIIGVIILIIIIANTCN